MLLTNRTIVIMDPARPMAEVAVVDGAYFAYVGGRADVEDSVRRFPRGARETLNLQGRLVIPGLNDSHPRFTHYVKIGLPVDSSDYTFLAEVQERLRGGLTGLEAGFGRWLLGEGWSQEQSIDKWCFPAHREPDQVSTEYPILILRSCFHMGALSSRVLKLLHISRDTVGCYSASAKVGETGVSNDVAKGSALDDIRAVTPSVGSRPLLGQVVQSQHDPLTGGLTNIQSDDLKHAPDERPHTLMDGLWELTERGALKLRFAEQTLLTKPETLKEFFIRGGTCFSSGGRLRISTVKLLVDGSLGTWTAFLWEPYFDVSNTCSPSICPGQAQLDRPVVIAHRYNMAVVIHIIGDEAAEMVPSAFQRARTELSWLHSRRGTVHCQILPERQLRRMTELDVTTFAQPVSINGDIHITPGRLGGNRLAHSYAQGNMERLGLHIASGTNCLVERFHPLEGVCCAVIRRDSIGDGPSLPEQVLTLCQVLYAYTVGGARASGEGRIKGRIRSGLLVNFPLVDRNLLTYPPKELLSARVLCAYVGGACVFRDPSL